jgi:hypothetical protein
VFATFISDFWNDQLVAHDRQWLFLVLVGLIGSFAFIRMSARLMRSPRVPWWPGSVVSESGVHLHHLVFGIVTMMVAGTISFAGFAVSPIYEICAGLFGIGMGLTIDEFALWIHLDDVYWAREGRRSVDAAVITAGVLGLLVIGVRPLDLGSGSAVLTVVSVLLVALVLACILISLAKQRVLHALAGILFAFLAVYAAMRLGKPRSPWARRFYGQRNPGKQARSQRRFAPGRRTDRFKERFRDLIGGTPTEEYEAKLGHREAEHSAQLEAAEEIRRRASSADPKRASHELD